MLFKIKVESVEEIKKDQKYTSVGFNPRTSGIRLGKEQTRLVWNYQIVSTDGKTFWSFDNSKAKVGLRKGKLIYVNAELMKNAEGSNYGEYAGCYKMKFTRHPSLMDQIDTRANFLKSRDAQIEILERDIKFKTDELNRLRAID